MSAASSDLSQASTKLDQEPVEPSPSPKKPSFARLRRGIGPNHTQDVLLFLIAFRILNALTVQTFFQPDEFFQSLEPAWRIVFGEGSGAWLTWEWRSHLRSSLHPTLFAAVYYVSNAFAQFAQLSPATTGDVLVNAPKTLQAVFAALQDFYTWKLAQKVFGKDSSEAWCALALTALNPWQWFCSTRTFSNGLETALTITALYYWPWHWLPRRDAEAPVDNDRLRVGADTEASEKQLWSLRGCHLLAGLACILRPTNVFIWIPLAFSVMFERRSRSWLVPMPVLRKSMAVDLSYPAVRRDNQQESIILIREVTLCGSIVLLISVISDRLFYQAWAFPPIKFLLFNIVQSLAVFYGRNDWHYYLSQGLPLLLTTALPFTVVALVRGYFTEVSTFRSLAIRQMTVLCLILPGVLSLISHKEVRFIYPLLPLLHIITAPTISSYFKPALLPYSTPTSHSNNTTILKRLLLTLLITVNVVIALYTTRIHAPGPLNVLTYLRNQYTTYYAPSDLSGASLLNASNLTTPVMTVGFLMPCHSTPWRSHLVYPSISAWALTCEPPLHLTPSEKSTYLDEADVFYANPTLWLRTNMSRHPPRPYGIFTSPHQHQQRRAALLQAEDVIVRSRGGTSKRNWPDYLVFFKQLEGIMETSLRGSGYAECWRGWNTAWHDDWRRTGDVVAWCLYPERRLLDQQSRNTSLSLDTAKDLLHTTVTRSTTTLKQTILTPLANKLGIETWSLRKGLVWQKQRSPSSPIFSSSLPTSWKPSFLSKRKEPPQQRPLWFVGKKDGDGGGGGGGGSGTAKPKKSIPKERDLWS